MSNFLKAILHRPFSAAELEAESEEMLCNPPLPPDLLDAVTGLRGKKGLSLIDWWRESYIHELEEVAEAQTWKRQRSKVIAAILRHDGWRSLYKAAKDLKHTESWSHSVEDNPLFMEFDKGAWPDILLQHYITSLLSSVCLLIIAEKLYSIDKNKKQEIDVCRDFAFEIRQRDFGIMEIMNNLLEQCEDEEALRVANIKDDEINKICDAEFYILNNMKDDICNDRFNPSKTSQKIASLEKRRSSLAEKLAPSEH